MHTTIHKHTHTPIHVCTHGNADVTEECAGCVCVWRVSFYKVLQYSRTNSITAGLWKCSQICCIYFLLDKKLIEYE